VWQRVASCGESSNFHVWTDRFHQTLSQHLLLNPNESSVIWPLEFKLKTTFWQVSSSSERYKDLHPSNSVANDSPAFHTITCFRKVWSCFEGGETEDRSFRERLQHASTSFKLNKGKSLWNDRTPFASLWKVCRPFSRLARFATRCNTPRLSLPFILSFLFPHAAISMSVRNRNRDSLTKCKTHSLNAFQSRSKKLLGPTTDPRTTKKVTTRPFRSVEPL